MVRWDQVGWTKLHSYSHHATVHFDINVQSSVASKIFEGFGEVLCKEFIIGQKPVLIVLYTRPGTCIKWTNPNSFATQRQVNLPVIFPESRYKIMDQVSVAIPQNLRRIFVATLI